MSMKSSPMMAGHLPVVSWTSCASAMFQETLDIVAERVLCPLRESRRASSCCASGEWVLRGVQENRRMEEMRSVMRCFMMVVIRQLERHGAFDFLCEGECDVALESFGGAEAEYWA